MPAARWPSSVILVLGLTLASNLMSDAAIAAADDNIRKEDDEMASHARDNLSLGGKVHISYCGS